MKKWSSIRAVYLFLSVLLYVGILTQCWYVVGGVVVMLQIGAWSKWCPSKSFFERIGLRKTRL